MKRKAFIFLGIAAIVLASCAEAEQPVCQDDQEPVLQTTQAESVIPGEFIVEFDEATASELERCAGGIQTKSVEINNVFESLGVVSYEREFPDAGEWEPRHREAGLHKFYKVRFDKSVSQTKAGNSFASLPGVESVSPVRVMRPSSAGIFNDPYLKDQWGLYNDGMGDARRYKAGIDVNVLPVWKNYTGGVKDVIVAVIDEGVDFRHPDLADICIPGGSGGSRNFVEGNTGYIIVPGDHGTHVAGIIAAVNNNGIGGCGIAGGLDGKGGVSIMSCQIFMEDPHNPENVLQGDSAAAMVWAADHGAVISQNSWSYTDATGIGSQMASAIDYFVKNAGLDKNGNQTGPMKGGVVIFAAGNESTDTSWPPMYENVTAVGAVSSLGTLAYYSNYGKWVDICAPGGDANIGPAILSTVTGSEYANMQGTSMACPHVSGVAALIVSHFGGPGFTNEMLLERLYGGANKNVPCYDRVGPLVDALGSFTYGGTEPPAKVKDFSLEQDVNSVTLEWKVTEDPDDGVAHHYVLLYSKDKAALQSYSKTRPDAAVKTTSVDVGGAKVGNLISGTISRLDFDSLYYFAIIAADYSGNCSEMSQIKSVRTPVNNPPVITWVDKISLPVMVRSHEKFTASFTVEDPEGHKVSEKFTPGSDAATIGGGTEPGVRVLRIVGKGAEPGEYVATVTETDEYGESVTLEIPYELLPNHAPKVVRNVGNILLTAPGEKASFKLSDYIVDEDDEPLTVKCDATQPNIATAYAKDGNLVVEGIGYGSTELTITVSDVAGKSCSTAFKVAVRDPSVPVSLYPNPVSTVLNVSTVEEMSASVRIVNKAGATVCEASQNVSPFEPMVIDMKDCAAGVYSVVFKGGSIDGRYTVIKK